MYPETDECLLLAEESFLIHWLSLAKDNRDREKSSGQTHLFNIGTIRGMDRTSAQPLVKLNLSGSIS
jgi:hypothetical protein